jgi:hypothetical protein
VSYNALAQRHAAGCEGGRASVAKGPASRVRSTREALDAGRPATRYLPGGLAKARLLSGERNAVCIDVCNCRHGRECLSGQTPNYTIR